MQSHIGKYGFNVAQKKLSLVEPQEKSAETIALSKAMQAFKILNYSIVPHYKSDHPESESVNKVIEYMIENKILFKALKDGEIIIIE